MPYETAVITLLSLREEISGDAGDRLLDRPASRLLPRRRHYSAARAQRRPISRMIIVQRRTIERVGEKGNGRETQGRREARVNIEEIYRVRFFFLNRLHFFFFRFNVPRLLSRGGFICATHKAIML